MTEELKIVIDHGNISIRKGRRNIPLSLEEAKRLRMMMNSMFVVTGPYDDRSEPYPWQALLVGDGEPTAEQRERGKELESLASHVLGNPSPEEGK